MTEAKQDTYLDARRKALRLLDGTLQASLLIVQDEHWRDLTVVILSCGDVGVHKDRLNEQSDYAGDLIAEYGPRADNWIHAGRLADTGWVIRHLVRAIQLYGCEDWMNCGLECQAAVERMLGIGRQTETELEQLQDNLAETMNSGVFDIVN